MIRKTWATLTGIQDRSKWNAGPWDQEPEDFVVFFHVDVPCVLARNHMGAWCGYAGVNQPHWLYGKEDSELYEYGINPWVHGGITWNNSLPGAEHLLEKDLQLQLEISAAVTKKDISRIDPDATWFFGFDCSHGGDLNPHGIMESYGDYRTLAYAYLNTVRLARWVNQYKVAPKKEEI